jgi:hypothetical protein
VAMSVDVATIGALICGVGVHLSLLHAAHRDHRMVTRAHNHQMYSLVTRRSVTGEGLRVILQLLLLLQAVALAGVPAHFPLSAALADLLRNGLSGATLGISLVVLTGGVADWLYRRRMMDIAREEQKDE